LLANPAADTLKRVRDLRVEATLERESVWQAQTPQVVRRELLQRALAAAREAGFAGTDDVSLVERLGHPVEVVLGSPGNLKITHPDDLPLAEALFDHSRP
jgi:2-C-methyl-D-erythritol 4-phosphate cytidylyltransferase